MIVEGFKLAALGMSVVFLFLILLILLVQLSSYLLKAYTEKEKAVVDENTGKTGFGPRPDERKLIAVVTAAIATHRSRFQAR